MTTTPTDARGLPSRTVAAIAGALAVAASLTVSELVAGIAGNGPSLVTAVGSHVVDLAAARFKNLAVSLFGTNDKPALVIGIVVISLAIGAWLGVLSLRRSRAAVIGIGAFALLGFAASATAAQGSPIPAALAAAAGWVSGVLTLRWLLSSGSSGPAVSSPAVSSPAVSSPAVSSPAVSSPERPGAVRLRRRRFVTAAAGTGLLSGLALITSRQLRAGQTTDQARQAVTLPTPDIAASIPAQPFAVPDLPAYVTPNAEFYRIDTALVTPEVDVSDWALTVTGMVDRPLRLTYDDLLAIPMVERVVTLSCVSNEVGGDLVGNARWLGVPLSAVLARAGVHPDATQLVARSVDRFTAGMPTATVLDGRTSLVAVAMNGVPLPAAHGFPARLVVAGLYGYVSATKWLAELQLTRLETFDGYWIERGWAKQAPVKTQSRIDVPLLGSAVTAGQVMVAGVAWAPSRGISTVEVQVDDEPWRRAELGRVASSDTWVQWVLPWQATPGVHRLQVRATDSTGTVQDAAVRPPEPDGATGYHQRRISVT